MSGHARRAFHAETPGVGDEVVLDPYESHHLARVLRLRAGDDFAIFDGRGGEWSARVVDASAKGARALVGALRTDAVEATLPVTIVQGACRHDRIDWVLQKGTEVGVSRFSIVPFARSEGESPSPARLERWRRIVLEACKQSGRRRLPEVACRESVALLAPDDLGIALDAGVAVPPIGALLQAPPSTGVAIAVGPEGGFDPADLEALSGSGWHRAGLGPRILRTETAGPVAAALVLHAWGDLGRLPGFLPRRG